MKRILIWLFLRIVPASIMLQTLYFKFSGAVESVYIFTTIGVEPWGRIGVGFGELIAGILLLFPRTSWMGALLGAGLMVGAIFIHFTILGIEVQNDGGMLFTLAVVVLFACSGNLFIEKKQIISRLKLLKN